MVTPLFEGSHFSEEIETWWTKSRKLEIEDTVKKVTARQVLMQIVMGGSDSLEASPNGVPEKIRHLASLTRSGR